MSEAAGKSTVSTGARAGVCGLFLAIGGLPSGSADELAVMIEGEAIRFAPGIASTEFSEVRLTLSPDGHTALWFSRDRPGGPGGYDIWMSRRTGGAWSEAVPVSFNSPTRDFDPAFSPDGAYVYFCSDRPGGVGGDDVYRVAVKGEHFGPIEHLGVSINSAGNEFAPMLSLDQTQLLFSSDRTGGAGAHDLYVARHRNGRFEAARPLGPDINTDANEFDATFLADGKTIVFARAKDFRTDRVDLFVATLHNGKYDRGGLLPPSINTANKDTYGPMLDWSDPRRFTFSAQRDGQQSMDLYVVRYRMPAER
jgi:TolB protein